MTHRLPLLPWLLAAAVVLAACGDADEPASRPSSGPETETGAETSTPSQAEVEARVRSEAKDLATQMEVAFVDAGTYPDQNSQLDQSRLDPASIFSILDADADSFRFCVLDVTTGTWVTYDSAAGGLSAPVTTEPACA